MLVSLALTLGLSISTCPSYTTCAFLPMQGSNPTDAQWNELFEAATENKLGAASPELPEIESGPNRTKVPPKIACQILKPIAAAESIWQQFCPDTGNTVISFDCGFGVMQVTSGAANYGPMLASDTTWNVGAGTQILIKKWNEEFRGGAIGDSDPMILENWYYAVWAYNGFVFGNNPDNPQLPPNRPPFNGPNSISRRNYPYQEIVWGYLHFPLAWQTQAKWEAVAVTYPSPGQVGLDPGPLPKLVPEHRSDCEIPCIDTDCDFERIIDDADDDFEVSRGVTRTSSEGGYKEQFQYAFPAEPNTEAIWSFEVPKAAVYSVSSYLPDSDIALSPQGPVSIMARGGTLAASLDQTSPGGFFYKHGVVKLLSDVTYQVRSSSQKDSCCEAVAFDAIRIQFERTLGASTVDEACGDATDCEAALVCLDGICQPGCEVTGCSSTLCNFTTGLCDAKEGNPDAGVYDGGVALATDASNETMMSNAVDDASCGCLTTSPSRKDSSYLWFFAFFFFASWLRRTGRGQQRPSRHRYTC
ncbi:MAG: hypothetical protein VYC39_07935 [Myxococcota bacterium]|nr:hypothetical protein [Myxococcota bacterium]